MKHLFTPAAAAVLAIVIAAPAAAVEISINPLNATWSNADISVTYSGNGTSQASVTWGTPFEGGPLSSYRFTSENLPILTELSGFNTADFTLGTFEHFNNPILSPFLTGVTLTLNYGISIGGTSIGDFNSVFSFVHTETINDENPCAFGGANNQGVNINGCADRVQVSLNKGLSDSFVVDGKRYALNIGGFTTDAGTFNDFLTTERQVNSAWLAGTISTVPEPSSWAMLIAGFGLVGATMRRRRHAAPSVLA